MFWSMMASDIDVFNFCTDTDYHRLKESHSFTHLVPWLTICSQAQCTGKKSIKLLSIRTYDLIC